MRSKGKTFTTDQLLQAIRLKKGGIFAAAMHLGCDASTLQRTIYKNKELQAALLEERGKVVDLAEYRLFEAIDRGDAWAISFVLRTIGKDRGYIESDKDSDRTIEGRVTVRMIEVVKTVVNRVDTIDVPVKVVSLTGPVDGKS